MSYNPAEGNVTHFDWAGVEAIAELIVGEIGAITSCSVAFLK